MTALRVFLSRIADAIAGRRRERQLHDEIEAHLELLADDYERRGLSRDEARAAARRTFGGVDQTKEQYRDQRGFRMLEALGHDIRFGARMLIREPGVTFVAVAVLGLGIGVHTMQFAIVNALCIRGLPIPEPDRVVYVASRDAAGREQGVSYRDFLELRSSIASLDGLAAYAGGPVAVVDPTQAPERASAAYVSANAFSMIGEPPRIGRAFTDDDDRPGAPPVVVLGHQLWTRRYAADPSITGRTIEIDGVRSSVIGVMRDGIKFPNNADLWLPLAARPGIDREPRTARTLGAFGRLRGTATIEQARTDLAAAALRLAAAYPADNAGVAATVVPINERFNGRITDRVWIAFILVGVVVAVIACANLANLLLMRCARRARELAVRGSLGATRTRIVRQLLVESLLLSALGGIAGVGVALLGLTLFSSAIPEGGLPFWVELTIDGRVLAVVVAACFAAVAIFGVAPALHVSKTDASDALRTGGRTRGSRTIRRWTTAFLTVEFALTVLLLSAVLVGFRLGRSADAPELALDAPHLMTMWVTLPQRQYGSAAERRLFYATARERLGTVQNVNVASAASTLPLTAAPIRRIAIEGRPEPPDRTPLSVSMVMIDGPYFEALAQPLVEGRALDNRDGDAGREGAIVNRRLADMHFKDGSAIGQRIRLTSERGGDATPWLTIVGIAPNIRQAPGPVPDPVVYVPLRIAPPATAAIVARTPGDAPAVIPALRETLRAFDPGLPLYRMMTLEQVRREAGTAGRLSHLLITGIASIALLLSAVGLSAVTAYAVSQRIPELAVRVVLGARPLQVASLVMRRVLAQLAFGLVAGIGFIWVWNRLFMAAGPPSSSRLTDPPALLLVLAVVIAAGLAACLPPLWRATRVDPLIVLRDN